MFSLKKTMGVGLLLVVLGVGLFLLGGMVPFANTCDSLRPKVLRLHIIADNDSPSAQREKLAVRDAILTETTALLSTATNKEEAKLLMMDSLPHLTQTANETLSALNAKEVSSLTLTKAWFPTKSYENGMTLPAGEYDALQIKIGEGEGKNWWCMLFPELCIPAASDQKNCDANLPEVPKQADRSYLFTPQELDLTGNASAYQVRFFVLELFEWLKSKF